MLRCEIQAMSVNRRCVALLSRPPASYGRSLAPSPEDWSRSRRHERWRGYAIEPRGWFARREEKTRLPRQCPAPRFFAFLPDVPRADSVKVPWPWCGDGLARAFGDIFPAT